MSFNKRRTSAASLSLISVRGLLTKVIYHSDKFLLVILGITRLNEQIQKIKKFCYFTLGAKYDKCGVCVGGTTNKKTVLDCRGKCGKHVLDSCGKCQRIGAKVRIFKDCAGDCFGKAKVDRCGVCYGGKTSIAQDSTVDICNLCGGNGTTCGGCDIRGGKKIDLCGQCFSPDSPNFNAGCFKIQSVVPGAANNKGGEEITITVRQGSGNKTSTCKRFETDM